MDKMTGSSFVAHHLLCDEFSIIAGLSINPFTVSRVDEVAKMLQFERL